MATTWDEQYRKFNAHVEKTDFTGVTEWQIGQIVANSWDNAFDAEMEDKASCAIGTLICYLDDRSTLPTE